MLRKLTMIVAVAFGVFAPQAAMSQQSLSADLARDFIDRLGQRTMAALKSEGAQQRGTELGRILLDGLDFDTIAMHTLGRYGRRPDSSEFREFATLFAAHVIDMAVEKFGNMPVESYAVTSTQPMPNGDVVVNTSVAAAGTINAGWRVRLMAGAPKIVDIVVDGYSMTTHFNGQFQDWLSKAGLEGLVGKMRSQVRNSPSLVVVREIRGNG
ncbi:MAG: ABC transporter substrate-binding protein [Alphaproteobacteria bacterium]|nr:ABC transporter substrate-binding protein [Alphaproteobacteria bacterium]